jgi:(5-formylfuran-3-yl)methyl phosphate synthase
MTKFLASVKNVEEAKIVAECGADIIDIKDPAHGALGAVGLDTIEAIVAAIGRGRATSAVTGDQPMNPGLIAAAAGRVAGTGVDYIKVGLFNHDLNRMVTCVEALAPLARKVKIVAVLFADEKPDFAIIPTIAQSGLVGVMLDTAKKTAGRLPDHLDIATLQAFVDRARQHGLFSGLAGSLEWPDVPRLLLLAPDLLGFRRALCAAGARSAAIDPDAVAMLRQLIPLDAGGSGGEPAPKVDYRLLAARGYSPESTKPGVLTDRIFVHDFVLPVRIGAYAHERERPQRVRFNVDIDVARLGYVAEDIRDVLSYDLVTDGIRMIIAKEHIVLVETLAERIAKVVLSYPRVARVSVRVEKLDIGVGAVGVEIARSRAADAAVPSQVAPNKAEIDPKAVS